MFLDGDVIPRDDFVAAHRRLARKGWYLAGGSHIDIPQAVHQGIQRDAIERQLVFDVPWLAEQGMDARRYRYRLTRKTWLADCLNRLTPRAGIFVGCGMGVDPEFAVAMARRGAQWLQIGGDLGHLVRSADQVAAELRERLPRGGDP